MFIIIERIRPASPTLVIWPSLYENQRRIILACGATSADGKLPAIIALRPIVSKREPSNNGPQKFPIATIAACFLCL
jgi:hypothetical protein